MASIKVKFRPSTVAGHEGTIYYQIIHERKVRQLLSPYKILPEEWNESRATVTCSKESERKNIIEGVAELPTKKLSKSLNFHKLRLFYIHKI